MAEIAARIREIYLSNRRVNKCFIHINQEIYRDGKYSTESQALVYIPDYFVYNDEDYNTRTEVFEYD